MPEIKPFTQWSSEQPAGKDEVEALREYTDYARTEYLRSGELDEEVEEQLKLGVEDRLKQSGLVNENSTAEELQQLEQRLFAPKQNTDFDANVVLDYLALDDPDSNEPDTQENASMLRRYLATRKVNPETAETLAGPVNALLQDKALVRRAREAAVNRGDLPAIALDEDDGTRSIYTGANKIAPEMLPMVAGTLAKSGALDASDFAKLTSQQRAIYGGKATVQDEQRAALFANTLAELSKVDPEINDIVTAAASAEREEEAAGREGFGARAGAFAVGTLAAPFAAIGELAGQAFGADQKPSRAQVLEYGFRADTGTPAELITEKLKANELLRKRFSEEEIDRFTRDEVLRRTNYKFDSTKPESGIRELSTGEVLIAPALLAKPALFEDSLNKTPLNDTQKTFARTERARLLDASAPEMLKLLSEVDDDAASAFAQSKAQGKSDREFLETWMSDEKNYSAFSNRMASLGGKARAAVTDVFVGIGALLGSEAATKFALEDRANLNKRAEFAAMFGDDFGLGQQALEAVPQVAVDMALTFGTAGIGRAATAAGRAALSSSRALAKFGISTLDDAALTAVRAATTTGGEAAASAALREVGRNWVTRAAGNAAERVLPVALPAFTRSATSTYVSIYGNLPENMTHEEKHKQAFGYSLAAGLATAAITAGMSSIGLGGTESLALGAAGRKGLSELTFREAKLVYEAVKNEGRAVSKEAFQKALAAETMNAYRNLASSTGKGFMGEAFEEALDQSVNIALDDAASKKNTPLAEKLEQVWNAGLIGGILGGGMSLASQALPVSASAQTRALEQRTEVLDGIAKRLSTSGAPQTASTVQRMMDEANAALNQSKKKDAAAAAAQTAAAPKTAVRTATEQLEFKFDDPRGVPPANTRLFELVGERVYIGDTGINGIAELDSDTGEVVINFSKPTKVKGKPDVARYVLGTKFQRATGVTLKPKVKTLTKPLGSLPAGTRTFSSGKMDYVLPSTEAVNKARAEGKPLLVLQRDENQRVVGVTVRKAALVASPTTTTDATITDPDLMREVLRLYPAPATPTGGFQLESGEQLEFDFNAPPPAPAPAGGFQLDSGEQLEFDFNAPREPELDALLGDPDQLELDFEAEAPENTKTNLNALSAILARDPVLNFLRSADTKRKGFATSVQQISDGEWSAAGNALDEAYDFIAELGDSDPLLSKAALDSLGPILLKYDTGTTIRNRAAAKLVRRDQGKTPAGPAPTAEPTPVTPAPTPAPVAKKAARPAPAPETPQQVLDRVFGQLNTLAAKLPNYRSKLNTNKAAREISQQLDALGFTDAELPVEWLSAEGVAVDPADPADIERLAARARWADSTIGRPTPAPTPTPTPTPQEEPAGTYSDEDVLDWLGGADVEGTPSLDTLVGKTVRLSKRAGGDEVRISSVEDGVVYYMDPDPRMGEVEATPDDIDLDSVRPYLESGTPEAVAEPAAETVAEPTYDDVNAVRQFALAEVRRLLGEEYAQFAGAATLSKPKRAALLNAIEERLVAGGIDPFTFPFSNLFEDLDSTQRVTKQLYDETGTNAEAKGQRKAILDRARAKIQQALEEAKTDSRTADQLRYLEDYLKRKVTARMPLTPATLVAFGPSGMGFVNLDAEVRDLRFAEDPNSSKKYFADQLGKLDVFQREFRDMALAASKTVRDARAAAAAAAAAATPAAEPASTGIDRGKLEKFIETVDDAQMNLASAARIKTLAKKALDAGYIEQGDHDEIVREANDKGMDPDDRAAAAVDSLLSSLRFRNEPPDTRNRMLGTGTQSGLPQPITDFPAALREILPAGFTLQADPNMDGALGYDGVGNPLVVYYNPNQVGAITEGLSLSDAKATLRTAVDHELGHAAADSVYTTEDYQALADELGSEMLATIVDTYYMGAEPDFEQRAARIAADRNSGAMPDWKIAAEWVRMEQERIVFGRTSEQRMLFLRTRPSLLAKFIESLEAFATRLRARFFETPTTGTAASISRAARQLRKLKNGGWLPAPPLPDPNGLGHAAEIFGALERGSDQTLFMLPLSAAAGLDTQVEGFWARLRKKFVNLPPELQGYAGVRSGLQEASTDMIRNFTRRLPKLMRDAAQSGITVEDVNTVLGRTSPTLDEAANARVQAALDAFTAAIPADTDFDLAEEAISKELSRLRGIEIVKSNTVFRTKQKDAEQRIRNAGHDQLADLLTDFRARIDKLSASFGDLSPVINDNLQVYLTRTYRIFTTEGWAAMARGTIAPDGTQLAMFRGQQIDFGKLRANAAAAYEQDAIAEAAKEGKVLSADELSARTHELLDRYLSKLQNSAESISSPSSDSLRQDLNRFLPKKNFDKAIRELLGEVEDPLENAVRTMVNVTKIAANDQFMRATRAFLLSDPQIGSTRPSKGLVPVLGHKSTNPALLPLDGIYTTPEIARALQAEFGPNGRPLESNTDSLLGSVGRGLMKASSFAVTTKTLFSIGFYPRNFVSGQGLLLGAQGIFPVNKYSYSAYGIARRAYFESAKRTPEQAAFIERLVELQILKDDSQARVVQDLLRGFTSNNEQELDAMLVAFQRASEGDEKPLRSWLGKAGFALEKGQSGYGKTIDFLASVNNFMDGAVKVQAYQFELDVLKEAYAKELAGNPNMLPSLEEEAARKVKLTFPSHSQQLAIVKSLNRSTAGLLVFPFARWKTEVLRTMWNTPKLAKQELLSGNDVLRRRGARRLAGFGSTLFVGGKVLGAAYAAVFSILGRLDGDDEDDAGNRKLTPEELYALRAALPEWQKGHELYTRLVGGEVQVIDMTAITPYAMITDLFNIAVEGTQTGEGVQSRRLAQYVATQIIGTQIAANVASEILNNRDAFDQPIYRDTDNAAEAFGKMLVHYGKGAVEPSVVGKFRSATRLGEQDSWEIVVGEFLGARPKDHKLSEIEYRAFRSVKQLLDDSAQIKSKLVTGRALEDGEVIDTLNEHQDALNRTQRQLSKVMSGLQSLGSTRGAIYRSANNAGFSKQRLGFAERGENLRWVPNTQWLRSTYENMTRTGEQDPLGRIRLIRSTLGGMEPIQDVSGDQ